MSNNFIQNVFKKSKKKGTLGRCTGDKFGGPTCPPGSRQYNFAKLMHRFAAERHKRAAKKESNS